MEREAHVLVDLALNQRLHGVEVRAGDRSLLEHRCQRVGVDNDVTAIRRHVLGVQDLRSFAQLGNVHVGVCTTN